MDNLLFPATAIETSNNIVPEEPESGPFFMTEEEARELGFDDLMSDRTRE